MCRFLTQTVTRQPNHTMLTLSFNAIWKAMNNTVILAPSSGGQSFGFTVEGFFNKRAYSGADWL